MMLRKVAKRRKLSYQNEADVDSLFVDSHHKNWSAGLQAHISVPPSTSSSNDWSRCKEGFSGFDVQTTQTKKASAYSSVKNSSKKKQFFSAQKYSLTNRQANEHQAEEIRCGSSDEEIDSIGSMSAVSDSNDIRSQEAGPRANTTKAMTCSATSNMQTRERTPKMCWSDMTRNKKCWSSLVKNPLETEINFEIEDADIEIEPVSRDLIDSDVGEGKLETGGAKQVEEGGIGDYDSDEDLSEKQTRSQCYQQGPSQEISASASLSSLSSPSSSSVAAQGSQGKSRQTAGEWVKSLQWASVTPVKSEEKSPEGGVDSAKKKRCKFVRDGLADKLQKIQSREKTEQRIWSHKLTTAQISSDSPKVLTVKVLSCTSMGSLVVSKCCQSYDNYMSDRNSDTALVQTVYFARSVHVQENIQKNCVIKIYPPWQRLHLPVSGVDVLFCTYYSVRSAHAEIEQVEAENKLLMDCVIRAKWQCPCSIDMTDATVLARKCPAYVNPQSSFQMIALHPVLSRPFHTSSLLSTCTSSPVMTAGLETVLPTQYPSPSAPDSILEAMDRIGHSPSKTLSFKVTVHRVIYRENAEQQESCSILTSDHHGVFCLIHLPDSLIQSDDWKSMIDRTEGCGCLVQGVKLQTRITKDREPALFSLIDSIWSAQQESSQDSVVKQQDTESQEELLPKSAPGFCYLFDSAGVTDQSCSKTDLIQIIKSGPSSIKMQFITLCDVCKHLQADEKQCRRVSFVCRVICEDKSAKTQDVHHTIYCTDNTLVKEGLTGAYTCPYAAVQVTKSRCLPDDHLPGRTVSFTDVLCMEGRLTADEYTRVTHINSNDQASDISSQLELIPNLESVRQMSFQPSHLPELCDSSQVPDLIRIAGQIEQIDEDKAYSWQVCDKCGQDTLYTNNTAQQHSQMYCSSCGCSVADPVMCLSMEVIVRPQSSYTIDTSTVVRIDLLQETIESLLPQDSEEEGYDMEAVIGQAVGPITCVLREKSRDKINKTVTLILKEVCIVLN